MIYEVELNGRVIAFNKLYDALRFIDSYGKPLNAEVNDNEARILLARDGQRLSAKIKYPPMAKESIEYELFGRGLV